MKKINRLIFVSLIIPILLLISSIIFLSYLPSEIPFGWDIVGRTTGTTDAKIVILIIPVALIFFSIGRAIIPCIDPKKDMYAKQVTAYYTQTIFIVLILSIFSIVYNIYITGKAINIATMFKITSSIITILIGNNLPRIKSNNFVGIINPWTRTSGVVWYKTHRLSGKVLFFTGIIMAGLAFINSLATNTAFIVLTLALLIFPHLYSLSIYYKMQKNNPNAIE